MIEKLKEVVECRFGSVINESYMCESLAMSISEKCSQTISASTLRRLYGFINSKSNLSLYNRNLLSIYAGFENWDNFLYLSNSKDDVEWFDIRKNCLKITDKTMLFVKSQSQISFEKTISREKVEEEIYQFLESDKIVMPIIAPKAFGKTTCLARWVEKASLKSDLCVLYLNAKRVNGSISISYNLSDWLKSNVFSQCNIKDLLQELDSNKIIIIILDHLEGIEDNVASMNRFFKDINSLLLDNQNYINIKLIISLRNNLWQKLIANSNSIECLNHIWSNLSFRNEDELNSTNLPLLNENEIYNIIKLNAVHSDNLLSLIHSNLYLYQDLSHPYYLQIYLKTLDNSGVSDFYNPIVLLSEYYNSLVGNSEYSSEIFEMLDFIISNCHYGNSSRDIEFNLISKKYSIHKVKSDYYYKAYHLLLASGLLYEELRKNKFRRVTRYICFGDDHIFEFISSMIYVSHLNEINKQELDKIPKSINDYRVRTSLLCYIYTYAVINKDIECLSLYEELDFSSFNSRELANNIGLALRFNNELASTIVPYWSKNEKLQKYFFETFVDTNFLVQSYASYIEEYLKNKQNDEALIFGNSLLFLRAIMIEDQKYLSHYYYELIRFYPDQTIYPIPIARWLGSILFFQKKNPNKKRTVELSDIDKFQDLAIENMMISNVWDIGAFEIFLSFKLFLIQDFVTIKLLINRLRCKIIKYPEENDIHFANLYIYESYSKYKTGELIDDYLIERVKRYSSICYTNDSFFMQIVACCFMGEYYSKTDMKESNDAFSKALMICKYAGYKYLEKLVISIRNV